MTATFEELLAEGEAVPVDGWSFDWFEGRGTSERPSWGYLKLISERMAKVTAALDIQTGGGEVLSEVPQPPPVLFATESWAPNAELARRNLASLGGQVVETPDDAHLPFEAETFDLVVCRHPIVTPWGEIARVLKPGGSYLGQHIGAGSLHELTDFIMGPQPIGEARRADRTKEAAEKAGLTVVDLREETLRVTFDDLAAVVVFLRKVIWTVPDFTVERYRERLVALHEQIQAEGPFVAYSPRFLIEARKP